MTLESDAAAPVELILIEIADMRFTARLQWKHAPKTCAAFLAVLPFRGKLLQARWSGQAAWIPLADFDLGASLENPKTDPAPGEILFHPADHSECEILLPYGKTVFRCKDGDLTGSHFLTILEGKEHFPKIGELVLWKGAQEILFSKMS